MIDHLHDDNSIRPCKCQDCGKVSEERHLLPIHDLTSRVSPGETMPVGECPACGALCHFTSDWDAPANRQYEPVETLAAGIYATFEYDGAGAKPAWVPYGNSDKQDEARRMARQQLRSASHQPQ